MTTVVEKILAERLSRSRVSAAEMLVTGVDQIYLQDGNSPTVARIFNERGWQRVFDPSRISLFFDHSVLAPDFNMADRLRDARAFAASLGLRMHAAGEGISHVVALECGLFEPGTVVIGTDSHTCTGGVRQALALGMGATDVAVAMLTGKVWLRVPDTRWIRVRGTPSERVRAKDVMLHLLGTIDSSAFRYAALEWCGDWLDSLPLDDACTLANMAVELGAKCAFLPAGPGREGNRYEILPPAGSDPRVFELDLSTLKPHVARPHAPHDAVPVDDCAGQPIDYVFIGSCANSRLRDLEDAARVLGQRRVLDSVHCVVTPGSKRVYLEALERGLIDTLVRAGALVTPPGCGACVGTQGSIPASGDHVFSTMNRNFLGRMGNPKASIWLGSALTAAHAAACGRIPYEREMS